MSKSAECDNGTRSIEAKDSDGSCFYSEIVEYLRQESAGNALQLEEWAARKSGDPAKWLRLMKRRVRNYYLDGDQLCHGRRVNGIRRQVVVGLKERHAILERAHIHQDTGVHVGVSKMYAELCTTYFWQGLYRDVKEHVMNCGNCMEIPVSGIAVTNTFLRNSAKATVLQACDSGRRAQHDSLCERVGGLQEASKQLGAHIWAEVEVNVLHGPLGGEPSMLVLVDPVSHWMSAQAVHTDSVDVSVAAAAFAFRTFCTFGFPSNCTVISESGIKIGVMQEKFDDLMKPLMQKMAETGKKQATRLLRKQKDKSIHINIIPSADSGISVNWQSETPSSLPVFSLHLSPCAFSSCKWAWESAKSYMLRDVDSWPAGLDAYLFEERRKRISLVSPRCAFSLMFRRSPFHNVKVNGKSGVRFGRSTSQTDLPEMKCREMVDQLEETRLSPREESEDDSSNEPAPVVSTPPLHSKSSTASRVLASRVKKQANGFHVSEIEGMGTSSEEKATSVNCSKSKSSSWRASHFLSHDRMRRQCQRGISRLLTMAQAGTSAKVSCEGIPRDGQRANFTARTVASVRESLEAKRSKRILRGNYQRYSPELREEIAKYALCHGVSQTMKHFSSTLGGKPISESTVRNFVRSYCSPAKNHLASCLRSKALGEEIGRFSACAGTEAAIRYYSSRLGVELKRGTVSQLRRTYIEKHNSSDAVCKKDKKGEVSSQRKRRYGALLREEIGKYAAENGVCAAMQHYSELLLFPVRERTIRKFLKMYQDKGGKKDAEEVNSRELGFQQNTNPMSKSATSPSSVNCQPLIFHQEGGIPSLSNSSGDHVEGSESLVVYSQYEDVNSQQQVVGFRDDSLSGYEVTSHDQPIILDQGSATSTAFCDTQELAYQRQSVCGYSPQSVRYSEISPMATGPVMVGQDSSAAGAVISNDGGVDVGLHMPLITSSEGSMAASHQVLENLHSSSRSVLLNHFPIVESDNGEDRRDHMPSQSAVGLSSSCVSILPTSSYGEDSKNRILISTSSLRNGNVVISDVLTIKKTMESELIPSYYSLTMSSTDSYQIENGDASSTVQLIKDSSAEPCPESEVLIPEESMIQASFLDHQDPKSSKTGTDTVTHDKTSSIDTILQQPEAINVNADGVPKASAVFLGHYQEENGQESHMQAMESGADAENKSTKESNVKKKMKGPQKSKRGNYIFLSPELRARIGRYAAEHGNLKAAKHFEAEVGRQIPESTIRGLRDKYVLKQMHVSSCNESSEGSSQVVTALGYAPRGRPMVLGKYDEVVQDCMHELVKAGERVCSTLAIATARQVLTQYEPSLLEEFGGPIKLNNSWAKSFIKRIGLSSNS
ncbi:uncharacterized protein LOC124156440 isoform X2 [Ischnura elegans]|uniref:uncharacterized protein LOC124156440 isoform X2 n=1 Tax=Ischnura elegans TaxID=197161 RepID=UPI001ED898C4|nr:uncharacterized protein LOC124156440 isoform X2 [Ischnura elegans]